MSALDKSGKISHDKTAHVGFYDTEHRLLCRKRIIRDLGADFGDGTNKRGFSSIRKTDQTHISNELKLQAYHLGLALGRRNRRSAANIPNTTAAGFSHHDLISCNAKVTDQKSCPFIPQNSAHRDTQEDIFPAIAC